MKAFLRYVTVCCIGLLSWWQLHLHANLGPAALALAALGVVAAYLTLRKMRIGFWFGLILGLGYGAEVALRFGGEGLRAASPLLGWAFALVVCSFTLLRKSREKRIQKSLYERPW